MAGEIISLREELTGFVLLNCHVVKLPSNIFKSINVCCSQIWSVKEKLLFCSGQLMRRLIAV